MDRCRVWANRGASGYAPENTLEAIRLAINMGVDGIKLDVQLTKDGKPVLIQDETIERVSNGRGAVRNLTLAELKEFHFDREYSGFSEVTIPTLKEALQILSKTSLEVNLELRNSRDYFENLEEKVLQLIERYEMEDRVWISSLNHYSLKKIKKSYPEIKTSLLYTDGLYEPATYGKTLGADAIQPNLQNLAYPGVVSNALMEGIEVQAGIANSVKDISFCIRKKADVILSNFPDKALLLSKKRDGHYLFDNPMKQGDLERFYLFGAGYIGQTFLQRFQGIYTPEKIIDNDRSKWGHDLMGIEIASPDVLTKDDWVIVASMYYLEMVEQLEWKGIKNIFVFDNNTEWE